MHEQRPSHDLLPDVEWRCLRALTTGKTIRVCRLLEKRLLEKRTIIRADLDRSNQQLGHLKKIWIGRKPSKVLPPPPTAPVAKCLRINLNLPLLSPDWMPMECAGIKQSSYSLQSSSMLDIKDKAIANMISIHFFISFSDIRSASVAMPAFVCNRRIIMHE